MRSGHSGHSARMAMSIGVVLALSPAVVVTASTAPARVTEAADERSAVAAAARQGTQVEIAGRRNEVSQTFALPNGRLRTDSSLRPQRVRRADGSWVPADATLRHNADGTISPVASTMSMAFSSGGGTPVAAMSAGTRSVRLFWPQPLPAPVLSGLVATYRSVLPGVDLEIRAEVDSFTHLVVIRSPKAAANPALARLALRTELTGLSLSVDPGTDAVTAVDPSGTTVFGGPSPSMWDSADTSRPVRVEVRADAMVLVPDAAMLSDPRTAWPVYVDPTWSTVSGAARAWTVLRKSDPTRSFYNATSIGAADATKGFFRAGRNVAGVVQKDRSLFDMDTTAVQRRRVHRAVFSLTQAWADPGCGGPAGFVDLHALNRSFDRSTVWRSDWNTTGSGWGAVLASSNAIHRYGHTCGPARVQFEVTAHVAELATAGRTSAYLGLRGRSEAGETEWKRYLLDPVLSIEYNTAPDGPTDLSADGHGCGSAGVPTWVFSTIPTLSARVSDVDTAQQSLTTRFYWWEPGGSRDEANAVDQSTGNPATAASAVPAGRLVDGGTYMWQAITRDDVGDVRESALCHLRVDATPPNPPAAVTTPDYPASGSHGGPGIVGRFTFVPPAVGQAEVVAYAYTMDSGVPPAQAPRVVASPTDRSATVLLAPQAPGPATLKAWTVDAAGRTSTTAVEYSFVVGGSSGPAARWLFDQPPCGGVDDTRHGNTLTVSGVACVAGRAGRGTALALDGDDQAATAGPVVRPHPDTGQPVEVRTDGSYTVAAWVRLTATGGTEQQTAVAADGSTTSAFTLGYSGPDGRWRFAVHGSDTAAPAAYAVLSDVESVASRWTHLAGVYDAAAGTVRLYVNGERQSTTATVASVFHATGPLVVGRRLSGGVDDVAIYPRTVAAAEIDGLADPLPPVISFPDGANVSVGQQIRIRFDAGGDANVVSFRYGIGGVAGQVATPDVPGGRATVTVTATVPGTNQVIAETVDITGDRSLPAAGSFTVTGDNTTLSGTLFDAITGEVLPGVVVHADPGGLTATTGPDGVFRFGAVPAGTYLVEAVVGDRCSGLASRVVDASGPTTVGLSVVPMGDEFGYTCRVEPAGFMRADDTVLPVTGDDAVVEVTLPFAVPFYEQAYTTVWVDTNGLLSFVDPGGSHPNDGSGIPSASAPDAIVAPYWDDLVVDAESSVRTALQDGRFVVEWRNVHRKGDAAQRVTFEAVLAADGTLTFNYLDLDGPAEQGAHATVGIESADASVGLAYSDRRPVLTSGAAVVFAFPGGAATRRD